MAPPPNDNYASAQALSTSIPNSLTGLTTWDATEEASEPDLGAGANRQESIWFTFTPTATGVYEFRATNIVRHAGASFLDLQMRIRESSALADFVGGFGGAGYFGNSGSGGITTADDVAVQATLQSGVTYTICIWSFAQTGIPNQRSADFDLEWGLAELSVTPPTNDDWDDATVVSTTLPNTQSGHTTEDATKEEGEPWVNSVKQTVWYQLTPLVTGTYKFTIPVSSLNFVGTAVSPVFGSLYLEVLNDHTTTIDGSNLSQGISDTTSAAVGDTDAVAYAQLTAGNTYRIMVGSYQSNDDEFNSEVHEFDLVTEFIPAPANDDFADAEVLVGSSDSSDFDLLGATAEVDEPLNYYSSGIAGTVWFQWVAPSTGYFQFSVEALDEDPSVFESPIDVAIYTGTALNALTAILKNSGGDHPNVGSPGRPVTTVGLNAINGTSYKIQVSVSSSEENSFRISLDTLATPVGDTTSGAVSGTFPFTRIDNFGYSDDELPPGAATAIAPVASWIDPQPGRSRWFLYEEIVGDRNLQLQAVNWSDFNNFFFGEPQAAIIAYKGANYASLTIADDEDSQPVVLTYDGSNEWENGVSATEIIIPMSLGEKLWVCVFGVWEGDTTTYPDSSNVQAGQFSMDLLLNDQPPTNDDFASVATLTPPVGLRLNPGLYHAGKLSGSTVGGTAEVGEPAHGGFAATRSVWYLLRLPFVWAEEHEGANIPWKVWVESGEDCVLSIYNFDGAIASSHDLTQLVSVGEDDDSGTGNWPEITFLDDFGSNYWVVVDSKTEATFEIKFQRQSTSTPPANDNFADASVHTREFAVTGTTVGATGEVDEYISDYQGRGPSDGVWYKYTPNFTGTSKIGGTCDSANNDGYVFVHVFEGADLESLTLVSADSESGGGGEFFNGDDEWDNPLSFPVVNGNDYYIRVATWSGGSEDFTIYVDSYQVFLHIQPSSVEIGPFNIEWYLKLTVSGIEDYDPIVEIIDSATIDLNLQAVTTQEGLEHSDSNTVDLRFAILGGECFSRFHFTGEGEAETRWAAIAVNVNWLSDVETRWGIAIEVQPGCD